MTQPFRSPPTGAAPILLVLALVGCGKEPAGPKTADAKKAGVFPVQPKPVKVTVIRDGGHAASASIPASGGTITAVGADGTRFTLTIPPKALDGDSTITMTPVSAIEGLPLSGGLVAAVHFEPEGLRFNLPVELRIEPPGEVPVEQQVGLGYLGDGKDLHLYPLERGRALTMRLLHFSGFGIGLGRFVDLLRLLWPADPRAQLEAQIGALLAADRKLALENDGVGDPELGTKLDKLFKDYYDHVVLPKIDAAMHTDDWHVMFDAVQTATDFARISAMRGEQESTYAKLLPLLEPVLVRGFDRAYNRCIQQVGGDKEAGMLMIVARNAAMTLFNVASDDPRFSQQKIEKCYAGGAMLPDSLELSFEATFVYEEEGIQAEMTAGSTMRLGSGGSTMYYTKGWAPIVYRDLRFTGGPGCPKYTNIKLHDGRGKIELFVHPDGKIGALLGYNAVPFPGWPTEELTRVECDGKSHPWNDAWWWMHGVDELQRALTKENPPGYVGIPTGMTLYPAPGKLSATIERTDFDRRFKKGVIKLGLKVLP
jgi:hypothetical protein